MNLTALKSRLPHRKPAASPRKARGPVVVLIHGLTVPRAVLSLMKRHLEKKYGRTAINIAYNSWSDDIPTVAEAIAKELQQRGIREFDAVTHSMGAILLRYAMNNHPMPKLRRVVLITPPNTGAWLAEYLMSKTRFLFPYLWGQSAIQLRRGKLGLAANAGPLEGAEIGIIAGGSGTLKGVRNWFGIEGDNDGIVAVEETILPGMKDFLLLNNNHTYIIFTAQTAHMVNLFLEHGVFRPKTPELEK